MSELSKHLRAIADNLENAKAGEVVDITGIDLGKLKMTKDSTDKPTNTSQKPWPQVGLNYKVGTDVLSDGNIRQYIETSRGEVFYQIIVNAKERQMKEALIKIGWTPPEETKRQRLITRYLAAIKKHNKGWVPDWSVNEMKYLHQFSQDGVQFIGRASSGQLKPDAWYMRDDETAGKVAAEFTDAEMKLILTGRE